jgi:hypothetical protein
MAMNSGDGGDRDETLQDAQLAGAYRAAAGEMPPAPLDDALRAAARREVGSGPQPRLPAWRMPLSLAAVVLLSVTVVLMMRDEGRDPLPLPDRPPAVREAVPPAGGTVAAPPSPAAAVPPGSAVATTPAQSPAPRRALAREAESAVAPQAVPVAPAASREALPAAAPRALLRAAPMASAPEPAAVAADRAGGPKPPSALWQDLDGELPEPWIRRWIELRRAGQTADAEALLAEFRRRFPDHQLPEEPR